MELPDEPVYYLGWPTDHKTPFGKKCTCQYFSKVPDKKKFYPTLTLVHCIVCHHEFHARDKTIGKPLTNHEILFLKLEATE